jgi:hypothetical protein
MEQILIEGIKQALARGHSLQQAMESFYYAGYPKEEIEKAARAIQGIHINPIVEKKPQKKILEPKKKLSPIQKVSNYPTQPTQLPIPQKISNYKRQKTKPGRDWVLILMLAGLFILVGVLLFLLFR